MNQTDYESLSYRNKFFRALRIGLITLLVALLVIVPSFRVWQMSIEKRRALREAKNVVVNMNLLSPEFLADEIRVGDKEAPGGLAKEAEDRVRSRSAADGDIQLLAWDDAEGRVAAVNYESGRYLIEYRYDKREKEETWKVFVRVSTYNDQKE